MDPFGTGDMFDIFRAIFDSPIAQTPDKSLLKWLVSSETSDVYPYDWYVDTIHNNVTSKKKDKIILQILFRLLKRLFTYFKFQLQDLTKRY